MSIGPINAVYQARLLRYLSHRGLAQTDQRHVWGVFGDGEMDEPESIAALSLAARENLDNLTFIINCNLQRLDGPVRGNGQIIRELESLFAGAGWNVIKVVWGSNWDGLFARDTQNSLLRLCTQTVDGQYQTLGAHDREYNLRHFFESDPDVKRLVAHLSSADIQTLNRGGHDPKKLYAAYAAALTHRGRPTVILAKTKKGYGMGPVAESCMTSHQQKSLSFEDLRQIRDRLHLPLTDLQISDSEFFRPPPDAPEMIYMRNARRALGGSLPARRRGSSGLTVPPLDGYARFAVQPEKKSMSTTMAAVRLLGGLLKDKLLGRFVVPIVADEGRTFGMASLFRQVGIYSPHGQMYSPEDSNYDLPLLPVYIFYSMFGFQRAGDLIRAAADQRSRGFLIGATAGRTTLSGEGLQHQDGTSHVVAATIPTCRAYDPAFSAELAVIFDHGAREMVEHGRDVFYYITVMNENYEQPDLDVTAYRGVIKGMYELARHEPEGAAAAVHLLGSGAILREVIAAARLLSADWRIGYVIWSVTSFSELAREAREVARYNRLHPAQPPRLSYHSECFKEQYPIVAATDYVVAYPHLIGAYVDLPFVALGTDGFGRSDTRSTLRSFFEVDRHQISVAALHSLSEQGLVTSCLVETAIERYGINSEQPPPWTR